MYFSMVLVVFLNCIIFGIQGSINCQTCDRDNCAPVHSSCSQSNKVLDECNCCYVCPKFEGEACGYGLGRCLGSLVCIRNNPWSFQGTCQDIYPDDLECSNAICINDEPIECSEGEVYKPGKIRNCCATSGKCVCRRSTCETPVCREDELSVMEMPAELSGACCDSYRCMPYDVNLAHKLCPEDSLWDEQTQSCVCLPCEANGCINGFNRVVESEGTGEPGTCCDQHICIPENIYTEISSSRAQFLVVNSGADIVYNETCIHRGIIHFRDETWLPDPCHNCICLRGRTVCIRNSCRPLPCQASDLVVKHGECCPTCINRTENETTNTSNVTATSTESPSAAVPEMNYCTSTNGTHQPVGSIWEDGCQSCICLQKGIIVCMEESCPQLRCKISTIQPGECCPKCSNEVTLDACELQDGKLTYEGSVIRTLYHDVKESVSYTEICQSCKCVSNELDCSFGPCDANVDTCSRLQTQNIHNLPSWLEDYAVVILLNNTLEQNHQTICSYLEYKLTAKNNNRALQFYTSDEYYGKLTYYVITASEMDTNHQYHTFKSPEETIMLLHSIQQPLLFSLKQVVTFSDFKQQMESSIAISELSTNMIILYSITAVFSLILVVIITIMFVVSAYTLSKLFRDHGLPCQKKRSNLSSLEMTFESVDRRAPLNSRYVEFHTKHSPSSGSNTTSTTTSSPV